MCVGGLLCQKQSVSQGKICSDNLSFSHIETSCSSIRLAVSPKSQYADTGPTSPCTEPVIPGVYQGNHWIAKVQVTVSDKVKLMMMTLEPALLDLTLYSICLELHPFCMSTWEQNDERNMYYMSQTLQQHSHKVERDHSFNNFETIIVFYYRCIFV